MLLVLLSYFVVVVSLVIATIGGQPLDMENYKICDGCSI